MNHQVKNALVTGYQLAGLAGMPEPDNQPGQEAGHLLAHGPAFKRKGVMANRSGRAVDGAGRDANALGSRVDVQRNRGGPVSRSNPGPGARRSSLADNLGHFPHVMRVQKSVPGRFS